MARLPRFELLDHPQHVIIRGNNRQIIFVSDEDCIFYLEKLAEACYEKSVKLRLKKCHTNAYHLN